MARKTVWTCDKCGVREETEFTKGMARPEHPKDHKFYTLKLVVEAHQNFGAKTEPAVSVLWCEACCEAAGVKPPKPGETVKPLPTIDDIISDMVFEAVSAQER